MKSQLNILLITLIISSLVLVSTVNLGTAQTGTQVSGIISSDTIWTKAASPYNLTGSVLVKEGTTLTIQSGVTVNMGSNYMQVNGTLSAKGTSNDTIRILGSGSCVIFEQCSKGWNEQESTGSIIENSLISATAMEIRGACPKINKNVFENCDWAPNFRDYVIQADNGIISNNSLVQMVNWGISRGISCSGNATIENNILSSWRDAGILIKNGNPIVRGNLVTNCTGSPSLYFAAGAIVVLSDSQRTGECIPTIQDNTIVNNEIGLVMASYTYPNSAPTPVVQGNNIYNNHFNAYLFRGAFNVSLLNNWWGSTNKSQVSQTIYDFEDYFELGIASFEPFLLTPNTAAPTFVNAFANNGGSIAPNGIIYLENGGSQTFNITASIGYRVADVLVNGTSIGTVNTYTLQNVTGATTFSASFALNPTPTPTPIQTATPTIAPTPTVTPIPTSTPIKTILPIETATPTPTPAVTPELTPAQTASQAPTNTPTIAPTQTVAETMTPSPSVPEFPTIAILPLIAAAIIVALVFAKRTNAKTN